MPGLRRSQRLLLWMLLAAALLLWGWFDVRRRGRIDPANPAVHKTDFTIYTEAGAAFFDGRDPYTVKNVRGWEYLYPPLFALLVAPLHRLPPQEQVFVWYLISVAAGVAAVWECRRISLTAWSIPSGGASLTLEAPPGDPRRPTGGRGGGKRLPPFWLGPLALLAGLLPMLNTLQRGQVGTVVLWSLLLGARWIIVDDRRWKQICGGAVLALPIVIKLTPALPVTALLLFLAVAVPRRAVSVATGGAMGLALGFLAIPALLIGWEANLQHLDRWWSAVAANPTLAKETRLVLDSVRNQSLANALSLTLGGGSEQLKPAIVGLSAMVLALLTLVAVRRARLGFDRLAAAAVLGLGGVGSLLVSPVSWGHHFVLLMPATAFVALNAARAGRASATAVLGVLPVLLVTMHYGLLETVGRFGILGFGTLLWFALAGVVLLRRP